MKSLMLAALTAATFGLAATLPAHAAGLQPLPLAQAKTTQAHKGSGVVKAVDARAGKVNLDHGPIASLGWGAMAMDFKVKDPSLLKDIKPGQKVEFDLVSEGPGQFFITRIAPVP